MSNLKVQIVLLILFRDAITIDVTESTSTESHRKERVNGRIEKLYSGDKPDPKLCQREGFQADSSDCSVFYRCLKGNNEKYTVFRFQCAPGTIFDPEKEVCNYPQNTKRFNCDILIDFTEQKYDNEIEEYQQELPKPIIQKDPENQINLQKPSPIGVYNDLSAYGLESVTSTRQINLAPSSTMIPQNQIFTDEPTHSPITNKHNDVDELRCTADGFMGDKINCKKFYRCVNNLRGGFIRYEFLCNDGTVWDDSIQGCNHAWIARNSRCGRESSYNDLSDALNTEFGNKNNFNALPINENDQNEEDNNYMPNFIQTEAPSVIPTTLNVLTSTYKYQGNQVQSSYTPTNQGQAQYGEKIIESNVIQPNSTNIKDNTIYNSLNDNNDHRSICVRNGFFGYPDDCKNFYRCVENSKGNYIKYEFSCSEGTVWDNKLKACNFEWAVKECGSSTSWEDTTSVTKQTYNNNINESPIYTATTYISTGKVENVGYGVENENTDDLHLATTTIVNNIPLEESELLINKECRANGFYGDENNCQNFYRCIETRRGVFTKYAYTCGEGTLWDPDIEACNHAWAVKSCHNSTANKTTLRTTAVYIPIVTTVSLLQSTTQANDIDQDYGYHHGSDQFLVPKDTVFNATNNSPSSQDKKCSKSGFMGDSNDCKKFYRCVDSGNGKFIQYDFSCGEGTVWDPRIESCNHAWAVEACGGNQSNNYGSESLQPITSSNEINYSTEVYIEPNYTKETTRTSESLSSNIPTFQYSDMVHSSSSTILPNLSTDNVGNGNKTPESSGYCKSEGFYPNIEDCTKFYRCVDDGEGKHIKYDFTCGEGTAWDTTINSCNHIELVKTCQDPHGSETFEENTLSTPTSQQVQTETETNKTTSEPITIEMKPTSQNTCVKEGYFGNNVDCTKFYRCVNNGKTGFDMYEYSCGDGTIWDQDILACNHPQDVERPSCSTGNNISHTSPSSFDVSSTPTSTTIQEHTLNTATNPSTDQIHVADSTKFSSTTSGVTLANQNANNCNKEGYFGDLKECKNFYRCVTDGKGGYERYEFTCGEGTIWDQDIIACNHPRDVKYPSCSIENVNHSTTIINDISTTSEFIPDKDTSTTAPITTSSQSITKESTTWSTESTVSETFTPTTLRQTSTSKEFTTISSTSSLKPSTDNKPNVNQNTCYEEGYFGDTNDCKNFYRCVYNGKNGFTKYDFTCGEGTIWDQDITACNHPGDVESSSCSSSSSVESTTSEKEMSTITQSTISSTTSTTTEGINSSSESNINEQPTEQQVNGNFSCTNSGFYPNPTDCKKFYRCVDWNNDGTRFSIFHFECGEGTIWDPSLDTCNYEESVYPPRNCNGSNSQTESSTDGTTEENITTESTGKTTIQETTTTTSKPSTTDVTSTQNAITTEQSTSTQTSTSTQIMTTLTSTTNTEILTSTTDKSTAQTETSSTEPASTPITTTMSDTTTTERSTTSMDQTTQTDRVTEESSTSEGTTQLSTTEQQSTSTTDMPTESTESDKTTTEITQQTTESSTTSSTPKDKCPDNMEDDQYAFVCPTSFRRHPKYCNVFYQCIEDEDSHDLKIALFNCPNNTIYDETKTQCVDANKSSKRCDGSLAQNHRIKRFSNDYIEPLMVDTESYACPGVGYFPFEKNQECSAALLKCQRSRNNKIKGYIFRCPEGYTFWTKSKRCERIPRVRGCKRSIYPWSKRYEIPKEIRNVAS